jgi:hypothetical protein
MIQRALGPRVLLGRERGDEEVLPRFLIVVVWKKNI